jgi:hypothetical protein
MDFFLCFSMGDGDDGGVEEPGRIESLLAAVVTLIFQRHRRAGKNTLGMGEVEAVLCQVRLALRFVSSEVHGWYCAYKNTYFKRRDLRHFL